MAAENWKERWPNEVFALGMISEIHLLERVLWVGVAIVTSDLHGLVDDLEPVGLATNM